MYLDSLIIKEARRYSCHASAKIRLILSKANKNNHFGTFVDTFGPICHPAPSALVQTPKTRNPLRSVFVNRWCSWPWRPKSAIMDFSSVNPLEKMNELFTKLLSAIPFLPTLRANTQPDSPNQVWLPLPHFHKWTPNLINFLNFPAIIRHQICSILIFRPHLRHFGSLQDVFAPRRIYFMSLPLYLHWACCFPSSCPEGI
jgi:hypothetical protein